MKFITSDYGLVEVDTVELIKNKKRIVVYYTIKPYWSAFSFDQEIEIEKFGEKKK
jgi:hypothetical protein